MSQDTFNRTLDFNAKLKYFVASWLLIQVVIFDAVGKFILILNHTKVIHLGSDFSPNQVLWGDSIFWNVIKLLLTTGLAYLFGMTYTYLARKVRPSEQSTLSLLNAVIGVFGPVILLLLVALVMSRTEAHDSLVSITQAIKASRFASIFLILQLIGAGAGTYFGINLGQELTKHVHEDKKGRLLGIKWYHYFWLWPAVSIYTQALLFLCYLTVHMVWVFMRHTNFFEFFGVTTSNGQNYSLSSLAVGFIFLYLIALAIVGLVNYQREVLSGEKELNLAARIGISIVVAVVIPLLLVMFTALGRSSA